MDAKLREEAVTLRAMGSAAAADYLIEHCPRGSRRVGDGLVLVQHVTWKPADQIRLARHYLNGQPHAGPQALEAFASFMSLKNFAKVVLEVWPSGEGDRSLFLYNLSGTIRKYETSDENKQFIELLLSTPHSA